MKWLYCHGFASGPNSAKGVALEQHYAARGVELERLNLRVPSMEHLRLSAMIEVVRAKLDGETIVFGSSLGGLTACRVAERDARVRALVVLAPAFGILPRWRARLGEDAWAAWRSSGWLEVEDHVTKGKARVDYGFVEDLAKVDVGLPDVRVPTLIVHGTRDDVVDIENSRAFAKARGHVKLVEVGDGHDLVASLPVIEREADEFLKKIGLMP